MAEPGETYLSPTTRSRMTFVVTTAESAGERILVEFENQPDDIGPPRHLHPDQQETYRVIEGELTLEMDGDEQVLGAGQSLVVPAGTPHTFHNGGDRPVRFTSEHTPALDWERFITTIYDLDYDGRCNRKGQPRPLQLFTTLSQRRGEEYLAGPPRSVQRLLAAVVGGIGRMTGCAPWYRSENRRLELSASEGQNATDQPGP